MDHRNLKHDPCVPTEFESKPMSRSVERRVLNELQTLENNRQPLMFRVKKEPTQSENITDDVKLSMDLVQHDGLKENRVNGPAGFSKALQDVVGAASASAQKKSFAPPRKIDTHSQNRPNWYPRPYNINSLIGFNSMKELATKTNSEVLFKLLDVNSGLNVLLKQGTMEHEKMCLFLKLLGKATRSNQKHNVSGLLFYVMQANEFINGMQEFIRRSRSCYGLVQYDKSFTDIVDILQALLQSHSSSALRTVHIILHQLKQKALELGNPESENLKILHLDVVKLSEDIEKRQQMVHSNVHDDFRNIPIAPNMNDLLNWEPFIRANIVEGRYDDADHYLDVQFRLLREDFVRPLRQGIAEYLEDPSQKREINGIKIYTGVKLTAWTVWNEGVIHDITFDTSTIARSAWTHSKKLLNGSLVCISADNFENVIFGRVWLTDPEKLKFGQARVQFEEQELLLRESEKHELFVMIESEAYFEAYRHFLSTLQEITESTFPLKDYIVGLKSKVEHPKYVKAARAYCIPQYKADNPTTGRLDGIVEAMASMDLGGMRITEKAKQHCFKCKTFVRKGTDLLIDSTWPTAEQLNMDFSQLAALKAALTQSVAIIQGPPGTGKTYVGLKIVEALLHNNEFWAGPEAERNPILVVCVTNHALDQFLEGVLKYTNNVVRIGGQSKCNELGEYNLMYIKDSQKESLRLKNYARFNYMQIKSTIKDTLEQIITEEGILKKAEDGRLSEESLKEEMGTDVLSQLRKFVPDWAKKSTEPERCLLKHWLHHSEAEEAGQRNFGSKSFSSGFESVADKLDKIMKALDNMKLELGTENKDSDKENVHPEGESQNISNGNAFAQKGSGMKLDSERNSKNKILKNVNQPPDEKAGFNTTQSPICHNQDPWNWDHRKRLRLHTTWVENFKQKHRNKLEGLKEEYKKLARKFAEARSHFDITATSEALVVGMTTTGAAKNRYLVQGLQPKIVIVEEAAEVLEAHIVTSLARNTQQLILIGDHKQLRPNPTVYELGKTYNMDISLFERLVKNGFPYCQLEIQHRMKPCMAKLLVPHIYERLENHASVYEYAEIKGVKQSMFFFDLQNPDSTYHDGKSKVNTQEAEFLVALCLYLLKQGYSPKQITILATYRGQMNVIKDMMHKYPQQLKEVRVSVVDGFQGEENDIILLSFVRSNEEQNIGFLKTENRVCVALSRARRGLFCIGDFQLMAQKSRLWKKIMFELKQANAIGKEFKLKCQRHGRLTSIKKIEHFSQVVEGGCGKPCNLKLECGHLCARRCHPMDMEHAEYECKKPCRRFLCSLEHSKCPRSCSEECSNCEEKVIKKLPRCGHSVSEKCHLPPEDITCQVMRVKKCAFGHYVEVPCNDSDDSEKISEACKELLQRTLDCGHRGTVPCGQPSQTHCKTSVTVILPCGHSGQVPCYLKSTDPILFGETEYQYYYRTCKAPCPAELRCGHLCPGTCGECFQGRLHSGCAVHCEKTLPCGHTCQSFCHSSCTEPCQEPCPWTCKHFECSKLCHELCDRPPCDKPCRKRVKNSNCRHLCIGLCGEPCPELCKVCDEEQVTQPFFGNETNKTARFVLLEDCGHIFEVGGLTAWFDEKSSTKGAHQLFHCPKCFKVIRKNVRFSRYIKPSFTSKAASKKILDLKGNILPKVLKLECGSIITEQDQFRPCQDVCEKMTKLILVTLDNPSTISKDALSHLENYTTFCSAMSTLEKEAINWEIQSCEALNVSGRVVVNYLKTVSQVMTRSMENTLLKGGGQLVDDMENEVQRLELLVQYVNHLASEELEYEPEALELFEEGLALLTSHRRFTPEDTKTVLETKSAISELLPEPDDYEYESCDFY